MQGYDLFVDMGYIDDDLVDSALKAKASRGWRLPSGWLAAAACVVVAALVGWGVWRADKPTAQVSMEEGEAEVEPAEDPVEVETEAPQVETEAAETEPLPVSESGAFLPVITEPDAEAYSTKTMIESYPVDYEACYDYAVNNGAVGFSVPLADAMAEYGDSVLYRIYVDIFKDGVQLAPDDSEVEELMTSLLDQGIVLAVETTYQDNQAVATYNTLHATYDQLRQFQADPNHGWMLWLFAERV